jgi:hypothetical protein
MGDTPQARARDHRDDHLLSVPKKMSLTFSDPNRAHEFRRKGIDQETAQHPQP